MSDWISVDRIQLPNMICPEGCSPTTFKSNVTPTGVYTNLIVQDGSLQDMLDDVTNSEEFCSHGDARRPEDWTNQGQYHILVLNRAHTQRFTEFPVEVNMFGKRWSLVSFVEYVTRDGGRTGHYWTWTKEGSMWYKISDDRIEAQKPEWKMSLRHIGVSAFVYRKEKVSTLMPIRKIRSLTPPSTIVPVGPRNPEVPVTRHIPRPLVQSPTSEERPESETLQQLAERSALFLENPTNANFESANHCFVNVAINLLYSMTMFRLRLVTNKEKYKKDSMHAMLAELFDRSVRSVSRLRATMGKMKEGQGDVVDALAMILDRLFKEDTFDYGDYQFHVEHTATCIAPNSTCAQLSDGYEDSYFVGIMAAGMNMDGIIANSLADVQPCPECELPNVCLHIRKIEPLGRHFIINLAKTQETATFTKFSANEPVEIFGGRWMLISFAQFMSGHYMTWKKTLHCWICISDNNVLQSTVALKDMDLSKYIVQSLVFLRLN